MDKKQGLLAWHSEADCKKVEESLRRGEVVISSTDTVLGFLALVSEPGFVALNRIKAREDKPYLVLMGDVNQVARYIVDPIPASAQRLMDHFWPGPLTIIFKAKAGLPAYMTSREGAIAIRVPQHEGLSALLQQFPEGLFSTSANLSGKPVPKTVSALDPVLVSSVAHIIIDDHAGADTPSTIVDCTGQTPRIVREGMITRADIERVCDVTA